MKGVEVRKSLVMVILVMMLGMLVPVGVWAEEENGVSESLAVGQENQLLKKTSISILARFMMMPRLGLKPK